MKGQDGVVDAKAIDINNYGQLPKNIKMTEIRNRAKGLQEFLKRDDKAMNIDIDGLRNKLDSEDSKTLQQTS